MRVLLVGQDDTLPGGMPVYIRSLRDYLTTRPSIDVRYLNETAVKGRRDMERPSGPALFGEGMRLRRLLSQGGCTRAGHATRSCQVAVVQGQVESFGRIEEIRSGRDKYPAWVAMPAHRKVRKEPNFEFALL